VINKTPLEMTKEEYLKICSEHWENFEKLKDSTGLYELEVKAVESGRSFLKDIIQGSVGEIPKNRRKKKQ
jgi:hypothetical protein